MNKTAQRSLLLLIISIFMTFETKAQQDTIKESQRPKIGLVLSGGGAKALAHVGVIKVLEELDIKPDYITGVSMGAIVGGLYSIGYSAHELDSLVCTIDWKAALSDKLNFDQVDINVKSNYKEYQLNLSGNSLDKFGLPSGVVRGQIISELLSELTWRATGIQHFDDFPIPFRCVATDIISGKAIVFQSGSLAKAMRASMSIPTALAPVIMDSMLLVDGGVVNNFPVQECIDMGADIIISIYVGFDENATANDFNSMIKVLARSSSFLGTLNSREQMNKSDYTLFPDLNRIGAENFGKSKTIVKIGEKTARQPDIYASLKALSDSLKQFPIQAKIKEDPKIKEIKIDNIIINGLKYSKRNFVLGISNLEENSTIINSDVNEALHRLYGTLVFEKIEYHFVKKGDQYDLVLDIMEKDLINIQGSIHFDNYFGTGLHLNASYNNLLINSSKLNLDFDLSKYPRARINYNIFGGKRKRLFFTLGTYAQSIEIPNFYQLPDNTTASLGKFRNNQLNFYSSVGISLSRKSKLELKASHRRNIFRLQDGVQEIYGIDKVTSNNFSLEASYYLNTLNHTSFPTKGTKINFIYRKILNPVSSFTANDGLFKQIDIENSHFIFDYTQYFRIARRFSIIPEFTLGAMSSIPFYADKYFLGGDVFNSRPNTFNSLGIKPYHIATDNFLQMGMGIQLRLSGSWYLNASSQVSMFFDNDETFTEESIEIESGYISGWAAGVGYESMFGPLKFTITQNRNTSKMYYYISLGFPF
ncbi:MAG: patatin-like phospholipase family protein [Bacteroidales bacterium]|nr:patatin-like phospholipase family protein [Bacteroidales bacterium]